MNNKDPMISGEKPILAQSLLNFLNSQPQNPSDRYRYKPSDNRYNDDNACTLDIGGEINHHIPDVKSKLECKYSNLDASLSGRYHPHSSELGGSVKFKSLPCQPSLEIKHNLGNSNTNFSVGSACPIDGFGTITTSVGSGTSGSTSGKLGWGYHF
ncbi:hypothetical protein FBY50_0937 [Zymomonas mobilis]|nr:hypothetical protein FBY50_0937 [Zymomonas mobilis]